MAAGSALPLVQRDKMGVTELFFRAHCLAMGGVDPSSE
ncbi:hypothetical protein TcasGA2_TC032333 [Tribolium castaneum]|uniref:Uncharacterized protein n=1 Tax=Tribolium castaneum TaxID=7070 RepID=A0A139WLZ7_TRICA|nr:hypothetical protein TcasGA2_TC032333 [Tribolium castaneum]